MSDVKAVVLAAGRSTRFGTQNKLLEPWNGATVVGCVARTLRRCGLDVLVVLGHDAARVEQAVYPVPCVLNADYGSGMGSSIACGVAAAGTARGYLIALGDMPELREDVVLGLIERFQALDTNAIVAPSYDDTPGRAGHPVLFGAAYRQDLQALRGDAGGRAILRSHPDRLHLIPCASGLQDIDTPEEYAARSTRRSSL